MSTRASTSGRVGPSTGQNEQRNESPHKRKPGKCRIVTPNINVADDTPITSIQHPNYSYLGNQICTSKYTWLTLIPKNLYEQFHRYANLYFLAIQLLNWLPDIAVFKKEIQLFPLLFVLLVTLLKDLFEDRRRTQSDRLVNNLQCRRYNKNQGRFVQITWKEIRVGDIIHLSCDEKVPADILILKTASAEDEDDYGTCYVETSNLDGESNLKQRYAVRNFSHPKESMDEMDFNFVVECDKPNVELHKFRGAIIYNEGGKRMQAKQDNLLLRDCALKNTAYVEGLVIYAGHEAKTMMTNKGPRLKQSRLERMMNGDIIWCILILVVMCTVSALGRKHWLDQLLESLCKCSHNATNIPFLTGNEAPFPELQFLWTVITFIILYQMIIPISLYVCVEMIKMGQIYLQIHNDPHLADAATGRKVECRALNITEDLGQVEYMFCDKTGTLTENMMEFRCCTIFGIDYEHESTESKRIPLKGKVIKPNKLLKKKLARITAEYSKLNEDNIGRVMRNDTPGSTKIKSASESKLELNEEESAIHDFFILMAICNTAMAADKDTHKDSMTMKGDARASNTNIISNLERNANLHVISMGNLTSASRLKVFETLDRKSTEQLAKPIYESESPDEVAFVTAAFKYRVALLKRAKDYVKVMMPNGKILIYNVLKTLPFDSDRKRMSIIVRCPLTNRIFLFCKGSDLTVLQNLDQDKLSIRTSKLDELEATQQNLKRYSEKGYRVLCMARRVLTQKEFDNWMQNYRHAENGPNSDQETADLVEQIESGLELLGATAIEDRLQHRVPEVITKLRAAGIVIWVLTGDKMETAVNIANSCCLFNPNMELIELSSDTVKSRKAAKTVLLQKIAKIRKDLLAGRAEKKTEEAPKESWLGHKLRIIYELIRWETSLKMASDAERSHRGLVIDGPALNYVLHPENLSLFIELTLYCSSVLCCRATPLQKSAVVKSVKKKLNILTMAVGDGANDVSMIQTAHIGVGITGLEGTQAMMASDFAVPRFHHLERLILVHGNLCYNRLAMTVLYFFYKNTITIFVIFFFQFSCAFSGQSILDDIPLMLVNICYTTFPPMVRGIFEKDCPEREFLAHPFLYQRGRDSRIYTNYSFWVNTTDSIYQSLVIYYITYSFYFDSSVGLWEFGLILFIEIIVTNLLQIAIETKYWHTSYVMSFVISFGCFFATVFSLDWLQSEVIIDSLGGLNNYLVFYNTVQDLRFWLAMLVVPFTCIMPRAFLRAVQNIIKPQFSLDCSQGDHQELSPTPTSISKGESKNSIN